MRADWNAAEREAAAEFIAHGRAIRAEREAARREGRAPRLAELLDELGRGHDRLSPPADRRAELHPQPRGGGEGDGGGHPLRRGADPGRGRGRSLRPGRGVAADAASRARGRRDRPASDQGPGETVVLPARTILVAAGTQPNTVLGREDPDNVALDGRYFQALDEDGNPATPERVAKPAAVQVLTHLRARRPRGQLLRRSASELFGQRRQGDGRRHAGLSGGQPHAGAPRRRGAVARRAAGAARRRIARAGARGRSG